MRITDLKTFIVGNPPPFHGGRYFIFVKLTTSNGIEGIGEVYTASFGPKAVAAMVEDVFRHHVEGADPFEIEALWRNIYGRGYSMRPDISLMGVLSGLEMALWDIVGKALASRSTSCWGDANWKLTVENYLECYHCTPSHPEYSRLHALEQPLDQITALNEAMEARTAALGIDIPAFDNRVSSSTHEASVFSFRYALYDNVKTGGPDGRPVAPLMGDFKDYDGGVTSIHIAPTSFFIAYPDHGVIYRFIPLTAATSAMELIWLVKGDAVEGVDYQIDNLTWLWRVTTQADKRITGNNPKGVNSRFYQPGPHGPVEPKAIGWIEWNVGEIA